MWVHRLGTCFISGSAIGGVGVEALEMDRMGVKLAKLTSKINKQTKRLRTSW
jgi:hypothetical protein